MPSSKCYGASGSGLKVFAQRDAKAITLVQHRDVAIPYDPSYRLLRARVPSSMLGTIPQGGLDPDGTVLVDITVSEGRITSLSSGDDGFEGLPIIDLEGRLVWSTLIDMHTHLDKGQVFPRARPDGTIPGGARNTMADRRHWSPEDLRTRMRFGLRCAYAHGVSAIRTHLDSLGAHAEASWDAFADLRQEWAGRVELQAVGLIALDAFLDNSGRHVADLAARHGGVLGGVTDAIGRGATGVPIATMLDAMLRMAADRGMDVDLHVDQSDDIAAFTFPDIAEAVMRTQFEGRVVCGHCVNLALQPDDVIRRTIDLCAKAKLGVVTLPTPMVYLQDRIPHRTPRWRGVTLVHELRDAGVKVAIAGDNCRDAWFPYGDHDMVDTFQQAVRIFQLDEPFGDTPGMIGPNPAAMIGLNDVGSVTVGAPARLILFSARSMNELMCRPQSDRIVIDRGRRVTDPLPDYSELDPILLEISA